MATHRSESSPHVVSQQRPAAPSLYPDRKGDPFHLQRPHGVLEVSWGHRYWVTAVALPKWINNYHCLALLKNACGPILDHCCDMWCDDTRLREELIECNIGSFVQVHIETSFSDLVRIDLQAALQRSIGTLHLPVKRLQDNEVMMKVFVPHGVTCFSGTSFENWQAVLLEAARYEFFGACHWTRVTQVWDIFDLCGGEKGWVIYHNNQRLRHHKVSVHHGDFFACYERCDSNSPCPSGLPATDIAQEVEPIVPTPLHGEAAGSTAPAPSVDEAVDTTHNTGSPTFQQTGDPLLLIGRDSSRRRQRDRQVVFSDMRSFQ